MKAEGRSLLRKVGSFTLGFTLGLLPFLLPLLDSLTYLIPLSVRSELRATTALLGGFLALLVSEREPLGSRGRKALQAWSITAPAGLVLLVFSQRFVVPLPHTESRLAREIVAPPRLPSCPCPVADSDAECLRTLSYDPAVIAQCWEDSRRTRNRILWSLGYLLMIGGAQSLLCLLWIRSWRGRPRAGTAPARHPPEPRTLFLSYSRRDGEFAERLAGDLTARGIGVWWDSWEMDVGDPLPRKIEEAISKSVWFAVVLSPDSVDSPWVRAELDIARTLEIEGTVTILPILLEPCEAPPSLRGKVWAEFTSSYEKGLDSLLHRLALAETTNLPTQPAISGEAGRRP